MKLLSVLLVASAAAISLPAAAGASSGFPPAFQGFWEDTPMACDPADGEGIGTMSVEGQTFVDTEADAEVLEITDIAPGKIRVRVRDFDEASSSAPPARVEIWTLQDKGQRLHIEMLDQAGKRIGTRERYRCSAQ